MTRIDQIKDEDRDSSRVPISGRRLLVIGLALLLLPTVTTIVVVGNLPDFEVFPYEWVIFGTLALARCAVTAARGWRLIPWLDLPLLGLVFVFTGVDPDPLDRSVVAESPLDPALFLIYALLAFYLELKPRAHSGMRRFGSFLVGFVGMYGIVLGHVQIAQKAVIDRELVGLEQRVAAIQAPIDTLMDRKEDTDAVFAALRKVVDRARSSNPAIAENGFFARSSARTSRERGGATIDESYRIFVGALEEQGRLLRSAARLAVPRTSEDVARDESVHLNSSFNAMGDRIREVSHRFAQVADELTERQAAESATGSLENIWYQDLLVIQPFRSLDETNKTQNEIRDNIQSYFDGLIDLASLRQAFLGDKQRIISHRLAIAILVLATLSLLAGLRSNYEEEVKRREQARAELEVQGKELEKDNWIALTAGLTHTIGNDILAFDAYGEEALDALAQFSGDLPPQIERNMRLIYDSNKARLGFIKFLDEFARARKASGGSEPPRPMGLKRIAIGPTLQGVRRQVGVIEVADLPEDSEEPQVISQRDKFLNLPLEVVFSKDAEEDPVIARGKPGILRFFFYELLKNALRNCSGEQPIRVEVERGRGRVCMRFINDLAVQVSAAADGTCMFRLPRLTTMEPCTAGELRNRVEQILQHCFDPSRGGGTGLGLFLIRYFAQEYYWGSVRASIHDWSRHLVAFELDLPDDLEACFREDAGV